jgi:preprotein translocase subunit SecE
VARNRKRAKERRARRPQPVAARRTQPDEAPSPLSHAAPDVELAEAQLEVGRPDLANDGEAVADAAELTPAEAELTPEEAELTPAAEAELTPEEDAPEDGFGDAPDIPGVSPGRTRTRSGQLAPRESATAAEPRVAAGNRLINFLQGSWRELQRVQWPDRRQVMQATGVVIGFVIVAGVFLGVADFLAQHLMSYILK